MTSQQRYGIDVRRFRHSEFGRYRPGLRGQLLWLLVRARIAGAEVKFIHSYPPSWAETLRRWEELPPHLVDLLRPRVAALSQYGHMPVAVHHHVTDQGGEVAGCYLLDGTSYALVGYAADPNSGFRMLSTSVNTRLADGRVVSTCDDRRFLDDVLTDAAWVAVEGGDEVVRVHVRRLANYGAPIWPISEADELESVIESHVVRIFEDRVRRGLYVLAPPPT